MASYIDFDLETDGHAGTELDPFSFQDLYDVWSNVYPLPAGDYYAKGSYDAGSSGLEFFDGAVDVNFMAWDLELYGPWRYSTFVDDPDGGYISITDSHNLVVEGAILKR